MQIKYTNTLEDIVAFNRYHHQKSDTFKKQKNSCLIRMPIVLGLLMIMFFILSQEVQVLIWGTCLIVFYILIFLKAWGTGMDKVCQKVFLEQDTKSVICEHLLEITNDGMHEKTALNEWWGKWAAIQQITVERDMAFIYIGPLQAHIIPRSRVVEGDFDSFVATAQRFWRDSQAGSAGA